MNSLLLTDSYKISHHYMYPEGTEFVYSNMTARSDKYAPAYSKDGIISFYQQATMKIIHRHFQENFFKKSKEEVISEIKRDLSAHVGNEYNVTHFEALHDLGYLPLKVKALPEGMFVPIKIPFLTLTNTHKDFYWLVNYLETIISNTIWHPITVATIIKGFVDIGHSWYEKNDKDSKWFLDYCFHNFAMRGMSGLDAAIATGLAFAIHSKGSDSLPVIHAARDLYGATDCTIYSLPATEHAVASSNIIFNSKDILENRLEGERSFLKRFITEIHPSGNISYVADTYDLWSVVTDILPSLKDDILRREGKLIIRPDSSPTTPADIICGLNPFLENDNTPEGKGLVELLWDSFGGTVNSQGYKILDSHIGFIYGEGISQEMLVEIYQRLDTKGFAASNVVVGIGSYPQQCVTRDTYGQAIKATAIKINGQLHNIYKDPLTSGNFNKKSAKGLMCVVSKENGELELFQECTEEEEAQGLLQVIYEDGKFFNQQTFEQIRAKINK